MKTDVRLLALFLMLAVAWGLLAGCVSGGTTLPRTDATAAPSPSATAALPRTINPSGPSSNGSPTQTAQRTAAPAADSAVDLMRDIQPAGRRSKLEKPDDATVQAELDFAVRLLQQTAQVAPNVILSPLSADLALAMTLNGAVGDTQAEMLNALSAGGQTIAGFNQGRQNVIDLMQPSNDQSKMRIANAIWVDDRLNVAQQFLQTNADFYNAAARKIRLSTVAAKDAINQWAAQATNDKIKEVLAEPLADEARMVLANAVYFLADWEVPFAKEGTRAAPFAAPGGSMDVQMMNGEKRAPYLSGPGYTGIILPYKDPRFAFFVILPEEGKTPDQLIAGWSGSSLRQVLADKTPEMVQLSLPKFELSDQVDLVPALQNLGMKAAFQPEAADFSAMQTEPRESLFISRVRQTTYLRVDEKGTEAAAVTIIVVGTTSIGPEPKRLVVDRPFICGIMETSTRIPLFIGIVREPRIG